MIDELHVRNVALIRDAVLSPARGLTVITGETGAGKTALLGALKLLVGERADANMVREGSEALSVQGRIFMDSLDAEGVVVCRSVSADGRSRVRIDGQMAGVQELSERIGSTVDLCGQHEHQGLLSAVNHRDILQAWAGDGLAGCLDAYRLAFEEAALAAAQLQDVIDAGKMTSAEIEQARYTLRRIEEVDPQPDEYDELSARVMVLENSEALMRNVNTAHAALAGDAGAIDALSQAVSAIEAIVQVDPSFAEMVASLREAGYVVEDVARDVRAYRDRLEYAPDDLGRLQQRMGDLQGLLRSWGPRMEDVLSARDEARARLDAIDSFQERKRKAQAQLDSAEERLLCAAQALHDCLCDQAPQLAAAVTQQMQRLEMAGCALECQVVLTERDRWTSAGASRVEFLFRPGEGLSARPLAKIASGGEVSRVMLAIKVVLGTRDAVQTLVFDEVDAGVGGTTANALAAVLCELAQTHQVIVVTHLAQVAACAQTHYLVSKVEDGDSQPETQLSMLQGESRVHEIARMLSGSLTPAALTHARELLNA